MNDPADIFAMRLGGFNRSPVSTNRDNEDVHTITKMIQEQTMTIEDEIRKVAELLRKQEENPVQKSISKQSLMKEHMQRMSINKQKRQSGEESSPGNSSPENVVRYS